MIMTFSKNFPPLMNDRILRVARGEKPDKLPIWIMRQAGRHMEEFRMFRKSHDFFEICQTPELACKVTLMPIKRYDLDAAIIFSDILVIPQALGVIVEMQQGVGPVLPEPLTIDTMNDLNVEDAIDRLRYVGEAINLTRYQLQGKVPLFGFSGAPWTLMGYMIEGGASKTLSKGKKWLYSYPSESQKLLTLLTDVIIDYLVMQVDAGAQILQVFESNGEYLNTFLFETFCMPYLKRIRSEVRNKLQEKHLPDVPMVLFVKGAHYCLKQQQLLGYDIIGIDWTVSPQSARSILGTDAILQGNLDPCALYAPLDEIKGFANEMITNFGTSNYIVNLGHGIYPDANETAVEALIDAVHNYKI